MRANFEFVNWRASQQLPKDFDAFHHFFAELLFGDLLHRVGNELQIRSVSDVEFDLVPDVGKKRPRIIVNDRVEHFLVWKADDAPARG